GAVTGSQNIVLSTNAGAANNIIVNAAIGDNVNTNSVTLHSGHDITDNGSGTVTTNGGTVILTAAANVGTLALPILTATANLSATAGTGNVSVSNAGAVTVSRSAAALQLNIVTTGAGAMTIGGTA